MAKISDELRRLTNSDSVRGHMFVALQDIADRIDSEMVELPRDRDGVPIHIGDAVYLDNGRGGKVTRVELLNDIMKEEVGGVFFVGGKGFSLRAEYLIHTRPDSWERIANELEAWCDRVDVDGDACDKPRDLVERIRRLAEKEGDYGPF